MKVSTHGAPLLTPREHEVMSRLKQRITAPDIALELGVSVNTIKFHMKNIYEKYGVHRRVDAIASHQRVVRMEGRDSLQGAAGGGSATKPILARPAAEASDMTSASVS